MEIPPDTRLALEWGKKKRAYARYVDDNTGFTQSMLQSCDQFADQVFKSDMMKIPHSDKNIWPNPIAIEVAGFKLDFILLDLTLPEGKLFKFILKSEVVLIGGNFWLTGPIMS